MSYLSNTSGVPPTGLHLGSPHAAPCSVPLPGALFSVPPPPMPPASPVLWWAEGRAGARTTQGNAPPEQAVCDEQWLGGWLAQRRKPASLARPRPPAMKIFEASKSFKTSLKLANELQQLYDNMELHCTTMSCEEWAGKWEEIEKTQKEVNNCLAKITNPDVIRSLKLALLKRKKKRISQKNERACFKKEKIKSVDKIRQLHKKIDTWLEDMQESVERSKREESLKVEADQVLSEVTRKKAEARRQLALLSSLSKLRQLRARTWATRGERVSAEAGVQFDKVIDSLRKLWDDQLEVYGVEERGLRLMLEGVVEERNRKQERREREIIHQWERLLFGDSRRPREPDHAHDFFSVAERDLEAFVHIRKQWDKFVAPSAAPMSSTIPVGWVLPVGPSSHQWAQLLQKDNKNVMN
ncbi:programmed cell death protein 7-like [Bacillus rossius redtenbacheri]|uniref:programmed cell death protein 7-like n=1 Tax=Bacillus rossius redtenbacheri TaxID=93214 RepID=UPI002FDE0DEE